MKTIKFGFVLLVISSFFLTNCDKDETGTIRHLTIASVKPVATEKTCTQDFAGTPIPPIYIYKEKNDDWELWYAYNPILGFDYQEGVEYVIRVRQYPADNPVADANNTIYQLDRIVSKESKESENIPDYYITE